MTGRQACLPGKTISTNVADIKKLKASEGSDIKIHGSGKLAQALFKHDLVDELCLMTFPILPGSGKRLFGKGEDSQRSYFLRW